MNMLHQCKVCGYVYDEKEGCPWFGKFEFKCPICGNKDFEKLTL